MQAFQYTLELTSDGEPSTGMGGEAVNSIAPRNHEGKLILPASHIKGLMREEFNQLARELGWDSSWDETLFGRADNESDRDTAIKLGDAIADAESTCSISRTAIDSTGINQGASLRTNEAVPAGTKFKGLVYSDIEDHEGLKNAWRLAMLAIPAVGGSRHRGSGTCVVSIDGDSQFVDQLAVEVHKHAIKSCQVASVEVGTDCQVDDQWCCVQLTFTATAPVCCPEIADKTNSIRSGFAIPASAVQGVVLHRLRKFNPNLSEATFNNENFRAWPLLPIGYPGDTNLPADPVRVGLTHRGAKFSLEGDFDHSHFQDEAIEAFDWSDVPNGAPLKAFDGVLLTVANRIVLWKASQMPHVITAHGVRNDPTSANGRNLFSVDSMAPLIWSGKIFLPEQAANKLLASIEEDPHVTFGKGRTVRGHGKLSADKLSNGKVFSRSAAAWSEFDILVAQSPLCIPGSHSNIDAEESVRMLANGWIEQHCDQDLSISECWGTTSLRFGWNRTTGNENQGSGFQQAVRVIDPGATIKLNRCLNEGELESLRFGIGGGRQQGFGAVSLHPGKASGLYAHERSLQEIGSDVSLQKAIALAIQIASNPIPSNSQWSALLSARRQGRETALDYLDRQINDRTNRIWATWESIADKATRLIKAEDAAAIAAITFLTHKAAGKTETESK